MPLELWRRQERGLLTRVENGMSPTFIAGRYLLSDLCLVQIVNFHELSNNGLVILVDVLVPELHGWRVHRCWLQRLVPTLERFRLGSKVKWVFLRCMDRCTWVRALVCFCQELDTANLLQIGIRGELDLLEWTVRRLLFGSLGLS